VGKSKGKKPLEDPSADGRIILIWIFRKLFGAGNELVWLRIGDRWRTLLKAVVNFWVA